MSGSKEKVLIIGGNSDLGEQFDRAGFDAVSIAQGESVSRENLEKADLVVEVVHPKHETLARLVEFRGQLQSFDAPVREKTGVSRQLSDAEIKAAVRSSISLVDIINRLDHG